jgi:nucleoside-diphosphate-sugar epimerase
MQEMDKRKNPVILVTGGAGFLGHALVEALLREAEGSDLHPREIRIFDIRPADYEGDERIVSTIGDVRSARAVWEVCRGVDVVFHLAAVVDWGQVPDAYVEAVNVAGTQNVIWASAAAGVRALVHTSTMDVVCSREPIVNADETMPFPKKFHDVYPRTKALAEQEVIKADGMSGGAGDPGRGRSMRTCALRPCGMYGERDPYHISSVLRAAQSRKLLFRFGNGKALFQHVYVGNVAHAHVLAAKSLLQPRGKASGQVYLVTDHPPRNFFDAMEPILAGLGFRMPPRGRSIPTAVISGIAGLSEGLARICRPVYAFSPTITRFAESMLCRDLTFSGEKAARDLGYRPIFSEEEAVARTITYFKTHGPVTR